MSEFKQITVVMYHYIRNFSTSRYPKIKGLDVRDFRRQIKFLQDRFTVVSIEECLEYMDDPSSGRKFPANAALLTFDDGYIEHYTEVFPILDRLNLQGAFFPPVQSSVGRKALDINKIHFIIAESLESSELIMELSKRIKTYKKEFDLHDPEYYFAKVGKHEHKYDPIDTLIFKRVLQRELPSEARKIIIDDMFNQFVGLNEEVFVDELYLSEEHLKCMRRNGMFIGGHGDTHRWMNELEPNEQENEIENTKGFLESLGVNTNHWVMSYPFGATNDTLINILKQSNCKLAFTTKDEIGVLDPQNRFMITRIDTNEILH